MKLPIKFLIITAVFFLAFTNRASADFHFDDNNFGSHGDHHDHGHDDGDHHHHHGFGGGAGGNAHGVAPEPVSSILFVFGAGVLALSYTQRKKLQTA